MSVAEVSIAVYCAAVTRMAEASALALRFSLPLVDAADHQYVFLLTYTPERLEVRKTGRDAPRPIYVDFASGPLLYRRAPGGGRRQSLAKAIGMKESTNPSIIDATPGLGSDAIVLSWLGCDVTMVERSPIIHAPLVDGLQRARSDSLSTAVPDEQLAVRHHYAIDYLSRLAQSDAPDVIYLDPMYPQRDQSALAKKEMRILHELVGDDEDAPELLTMALARAKRRVVVKPSRRLAPLLKGLPLDVQLKGQSTRYDVYIAPRA
jgi:16S rRNA (guanine1516-N2)-methyltransferase